MNSETFQNVLRNLIPIVFVVFSHVVFGQETSSGSVMVSDTMKGQDNNRLNFYILTMDFTHKVDVFGFSVKLRADIRSLFSKKKLYVIKATNAGQIAQKMTAILQKEQAMVGTVWFDSHGAYRSCVSSINIGSDAFNYRNIMDSATTAPLRQIARYCDRGSSIGIGSCYGGATFIKPATDSTPEVKMNGDSLMIGMAKIFYGSTVYGSESWVMVKFGMFGDSFGLAGYPLGERYKDAGWKPVWEKLGDWNRYNAETDEFAHINTVGLNRKGSITVRMRDYQELSKGKKAVKRNLVKL